MARETVFSSFRVSARARQEPETRPDGSLQIRRRGAADGERLSATKLGVVAFSTSGDAELGDFDDQPVILFKAGQLPATFED